MDSTMLEMDVACHICGASKLNTFEDYPALPRVTSDCLPWRSGGKLAICMSCNCVQNPTDKAWYTETSEIYSKYQIYRQSAGSEQGMLGEGNKLVPRSAKVFQHSAPYLDLNKTGRLLDIGCANGELLRCFGAIAPHWKMVGFEIDDKRRQEVERIPGVEQFASGSLDKVNGSFDIISLIHVLEHLPRPGKWLEDLQRILNPGGIVIIQVPDPKQNPYNLLVADHCSHFLIPELLTISEKAGYEILAYSDKWVSREFSLLIAPKSDPKSIHFMAEQPKETSFSYPLKSIQWLRDVIEKTTTIPYNKPRGIWGTAIAATWAFSVMDKVDFFVDEDINRIGQEHLGRPIYAPDNIPKNANIFVALTPEIASNIVARWSHLDVTLHVPPSLYYE